MVEGKERLGAPKGARRILNRRNAAYAVGAGMIADILASLFAPQYSGVLSGIARLLTGG